MKDKIITHHPNGNIKSIQYFYKNLRHNKNGPAIILYDELGNVKQKKYYLLDVEYTEDEHKIRILCGLDKNLQHREYFYENGQIEIEEWLLDGKYHNEEGPALIWYYENGHIKEEQYFIKDKFHNKNGPAVIMYDKYGNVKKQIWFLNGIKTKRIY